MFVAQIRQYFVSRPGKYGDEDIKTRLDGTDYTMGVSARMSDNGVWSWHVSITAGENDTKHHAWTLSLNGTEKGGSGSPIDTSVRGFASPEWMIENCERLMKVKPRMQGHRQREIPTLNKEQVCGNFKALLSKYSPQIRQMKVWLIEQIERVKSSIKLHTGDQVAEGPGEYLIDHKGHYYQFIWRVSQKQHTEYQRTDDYLAPVKHIYHPKVEVHFDFKTTAHTKEAAQLLDGNEYLTIAVHVNEKGKPGFVIHGLGGGEHKFKGFVAMDVTEFEDLEHVLLKSRSLKFYALIQLLLGVAGYQKLCQAYSRVVHEALLTANILVQRRDTHVVADESTRSRICDFLIEGELDQLPSQIRTLT